MDNIAELLMKHVLCVSNNTTQHEGVANYTACVDRTEVLYGVHITNLEHI